MTTGYIYNIGKLIHQNEGELVDAFDGCLLDNYLYQAKRGMFALYESYVNSNSSRYLFKFARTGDEIRELWDEFIERRGDDDVME